MKSYIKWLFYLVTFILIGTVGCKKSAQQDQNIVAKIGEDYTISFLDLNAFVKRNLYHRMYRDPMVAYNKALDIMVLNQLKRIDFVNQGLQNDEDLLYNIRRTINEEIIVKYFESQFLGKYTTDEYALKTYENMKREVIYKQIVLNKPENASEDDILTLKNKANDIKAKIDQGESFDELARQYSESANNDGLMPPLRWIDRTKNQLFSYIFFQKAGDVFILETPRSINIINILDVKMQDLAPFDQLKKVIISDLEKDYMDVSLSDYDQMKESLLDKSSFIWNSKALNQIVTWSKNPDFYQTQYKETIEKAIEDGNNPVILKYSGGEVDLKEYLRLANEILILSGSVNILEDDVKKYIIDAVRTDLTVKKAKELNLDKDIINPNTTNTVIQYQLVKLYEKMFIDDKIPEPTEAILQKFYEEQKDSTFYQLMKINVNAIILPDKAEVDKMWAKIEQGNTFEQVTNRYYVKTYIKTRDGEIRVFGTKVKDPLGEAAFKLKETEMKGVIEFKDPEKGQMYAIIKCTRITPEKQLTYADAQKTINDQYQKITRKKIQVQVENDLLKKYTPTVYRDVLKKKLSVTK